MAPCALDQTYTVPYYFYGLWPSSGDHIHRSYAFITLKSDGFRIMAREVLTKVCVYSQWPGAAMQQKDGGFHHWLRWVSGGELFAVYNNKVLPLMNWKVGGRWVYFKICKITCLIVGLYFLLFWFGWKPVVVYFSVFLDRICYKKRCHHLWAQHKTRPSLGRKSENHTKHNMKENLQSLSLLACTIHVLPKVILDRPTRMFLLLS